MYLENIKDFDSRFKELLLKVVTMNAGPKFNLSYEDLHEISYDMIQCDIGWKLEYTKQQFGKELKQLVTKHHPIEKIANWASSIYLEDIQDATPSFDQLLGTLSIMCCGPEFERSYKELLDIANRLIAGEDFKLD